MDRWIDGARPRDGKVWWMRWGRDVHVAWWDRGTSWDGGWRRMDSPGCLVLTDPDAYAPYTTGEPHPPLPAEVPAEVPTLPDGWTWHRQEHGGRWVASRKSNFHLGAGTVHVSDGGVVVQLEGGDVRFGHDHIAEIVGLVEACNGGAQ
jgi:hypothetical protein